jgi:hypothetical protein
MCGFCERLIRPYVVKVVAMPAWRFLFWSPGKRGGLPPELFQQVDFAKQSSNISRATFIQRALLRVMRVKVIEPRKTQRPHNKRGQ